MSSKTAFSPAGFLQHTPHVNIVIISPTFSLHLRGRGPVQTSGAVEVLTVLLLYAAIPTMALLRFDPAAV